MPDINLPPTTNSFGNISLVVLATKPATLASIPLSAITAGKNITCHAVGDWLPTASTEKTARSRKMCQKKTTQALGVTTHETPALVYTYNPQAIGTPGAPGNEAYEALAPGAVVYGVQRLGKAGDSAYAAGDKIRVFPLDLGPQTPGVSSEDAGGEFVINQETAFAPGFDEPVDGVIAA